MYLDLVSLVEHNTRHPSQSLLLRGTLEMHTTLQVRSHF
jgi:hypothetical protein